MSLLSDEEISQISLSAVTVKDATDDVRAIEAAILAKLAAKELPEPIVWRDEGYEGWHASKFIEEDTIETYTADQLRQAHAQGFAAGAAAQLSAEPSGFIDKYGEIFAEVEQMLSTDTPLYTRREA